MYLFDESEDWISANGFEATRSDGLVVRLNIPDWDETITFTAYDYRPPYKRGNMPKTVLLASATTLDDAARQADTIFPLLSKDDQIEAKRNELSFELRDLNSNKDDMVQKLERINVKLKSVSAAIAALEVPEEEFIPTWNGIKVKTVESAPGYEVHVSSDFHRVKIPGVFKKETAEKLRDAMIEVLRLNK